MGDTLPLINNNNNTTTIAIPPFPALPTVQQSQSISPNMLTMNTTNNNIIQPTPLAIQSHSMSPTININNITNNKKRLRDSCIDDNKDTKRRV